MPYQAVRDAYSKKHPLAKKVLGLGPGPANKKHPLYKPFKEHYINHIKTMAHKLSHAVDYHKLSKAHAGHVLHSFHSAGNS